MKTILSFCFAIAVAAALTLVSCSPEPLSYARNKIAQENHLLASACPIPAGNWFCAEVSPCSHDEISVDKDCSVEFKALDDDGSETAPVGFAAKHLSRSSDDSSEILLDGTEHYTNVAPDPSPSAS